MFYRLEGQVFGCYRRKRCVYLQCQSWEPDGLVAAGSWQLAACTWQFA